VPIRHVSLRHTRTASSWSRDDPSDPDVSIARARVLQGVTTEWHRVKDIDERYIIVRGKGKLEVGDLPPAVVSGVDSCGSRRTRRSASRISATTTSCSSACALHDLCTALT
jgi:hypothetical protein